MTLVIAICLLAHPDRCQTIAVPLDEGVTLLQCQGVSEFAVSVAMQDYPGWWPVSWHCEEGTRS